MLWLEFIFTLYVLIGLLVQLGDIIFNFQYWRGEKGSFIVLMAVVFALLWPLAVWDYIRYALQKSKGGIGE